MCGIGGCVCPDGRRPSVDRLRELISALGHRGPDDQGILIDGSVGLVNTRLAILDPNPRGRQPMEHPGGRWAVTYNGEVFNHQDIRSRLNRQEYVGHSDTETILQAFAEWGEEAISRFNGFFALALMDRERKRILLVRDRFGIKPLYFAFQGGVLWFASEIQALLAVGIPRAPHRHFLYHTLSRGWVDGPETPIEGISRVLPGTAMTFPIKETRIEQRRWHHPAQDVNTRRQPEFVSRSRTELVELLERELNDAVARRLLSDVPVGTMCSGGIDSSLITAMARENQPDIVAFNASITGDRHRDEVRWAHRVTDALGIELDVVPMTAEHWRAAFVQTVKHLEYPLGEESAVSIASIAATARRRGIKVLLTGEGADELFGGYWSLKSPTYLKQFLPATARLRYRLDALRKGGAAERLRSAKQMMVRHRQHAAIPLATELPSAEAFDQTVAGQARFAYLHHSGCRARLEAKLLGELSTGLPYLLTRLDKSGMQHSVEVRPPFLDPEVVGLAASLPLEARITPHSKGILRDLAGRRLPRSVAVRPKQPGMRVNTRVWIERAARPDFLRDGYLRELLGMADTHWANVIEGLDDESVILFWSAEVWCRLMLEASKAATVERELWR